MRTHARHTLWLVMALLLSFGLTGCYRSMGGSLEPTESSLGANNAAQQESTPLPEPTLAEQPPVEEPTAEQMESLPTDAPATDATTRPTLPPAPTQGPSPTPILSATAVVNRPPTDVVSLPAEGQADAGEAIPQQEATQVAMAPTATLSPTPQPTATVTPTPPPTNTATPAYLPPPSFTPSTVNIAPGEAVPLAERPTETLPPGSELADGQGGMQPSATPAAVAQIPTLTILQMTATQMMSEYNATQAALQGTILPPSGQPQQPGQPAATLPPAGAQFQFTPTPTPPAGQCGTHLIAPGENLFRIALSYNVTVEQIAAANNIVNPSLILAGDTLIIPCPQPTTGNEGTTTGATTTTTTTSPGTYLVEPGDNIYRISLRFGVSMAALMRANGLTPATINTIYAGQQLVIPAG